MSEVVCSCGQASPATARFCASCGSPLGAAQPESAERQVLETLRGFVSAQVADRVASGGRSALEERRIVTAVFADLSGFTTLAGRLDAEELLGVIDPVIAGLTRIVTRYDGYVEKFAGDALLALFGAPVAHEDDAARALSVALDMQAELAGLASHDAAHDLTLHVGVNTGTVVARTVGSEARMDYAVLGEAVILAQRLESLAPSGEIFVGALTRQLAGPGFVFDDLGPLAVKGRLEPVPTHRLVGRRPEGLWMDPGAMVGRGAELVRLRAALATTRAGGAELVRVVGPAGSGKSRLLQELRRDAAAAGVRVVELFGASHAQSPYRCLLPLVEAALGARYPWTEDVEDRLRRVAADPDAPASAVLSAVLAGQSRAAADLGPAAPDAVRRQLGDAALAWLADLAGRGPLLLVADGLHAFDAASREVLDRAADASAPGVLLCLSGRAEVSTGSDGSDRVPRRPGVEVVLGPLPRPAVRDLVATELALVPDDRLVDHVAARGQGNPLMVRETVRQLRAEGLLDVQHGHARFSAGAATDSVPATLEALLAARLDALPPAVVRVATTAAVIGFVTPAPLLAAVAGLAPDELDLPVAELVAARFLRLDADAGADDVVPGGPRRTTVRWRFEGALVRDLLYARLTGRRRQELHARVADTLGEPDDPDDELVALLAEHRYLAGDLAAALPWLRRAASYARRLFAQDTAAHTLVRAVRCARAVAPEQLVDLLVELAEVRADGGELDRAAELYAEARTVGNDTRAWAGGASVLRRQGRYADALALLEAADAADPSGDLRLVELERAWTLSVSGDLQGCLAAAGAGLAAGDPDDRVAGLLLLQMMRCETLLEDRAAAEEHAARALENLGRAADDVGLCTALRLLGWLQQSSGDLQAAAATLERGLALARRTGLVEEIGGCQINLGLVHADAGDHRAAEQAYLDAAVTFEQAGFDAGRAMAYGNRSCELLALGEYESARALGLEALALAERIGDHLSCGDVHQTLALVAERTGDAAEARRQAEAAIEGFTRAGAPAEASGSRALLVRLGG